MMGYGRFGRTNPMAVVHSLHSMRADYAASQTNRFRRQRPGIGGSADAHMTQQAQRYMMEHSRAMDRDDMLIGQLFDRACDSIVHNGFTLEPDTGDEKLNEDIKETVWRPWAEDARACDVAGQLTFADMEWLGWRHSLVDGDHFVLLFDNGQMQPVEADRCQSPRSVVNRNQDLILGVLLNKLGKPLEYWFAKNWKRDRKAQVIGDVERVSAVDADGNPKVCHIVDRKRVTQTRGVIALKSVIDTCGMFEDTNFAAVVRQQISSLFGILLEQTDNALAGGGFRLGNQAATTGPAGDTFYEEELRPGLIVRLPKGFKPHEYSPKFPNQEWMQHMLFLVRVIGAQLHLPLFMCLLHGGEEVFHAHRSLLDMHYRSAEVAQQGFIDRFHRPAYLFRLRHAAKSDPALRSSMERLKSRFWQHKWIPPKWRYINPDEDTKADERRLNNLMISPTQLGAERGYNRKRVVDETIRDNKYAIEGAIKAATEIKSEHGVEVPWHMMLKLTAGQKEVPETAKPEDRNNARASARGRKGAARQRNRMAVHMNGQGGQGVGPGGGREGSHA